MPVRMNRRSALGAIAAAGLAPWAWAQQQWPDRPLRLVHGFGAGGNADVVARLVAQALQEQIGQPVVVEIKSGAGGMVATSLVAKAPADGYTLLMLTGGHTASAAMRKTLPYDPVNDFSFLSTVTNFPFVIAVREDHPAKTLAELVQLARSGTNKISFTSVGVGSTQHLVGELLAVTAQAHMLHVPYRGGGAPVQSVIGGDVDVLSDTLTVALPHIQSGRLRALAVTSPAPWPSLPEVPPVAQTLPGFDVRSWLGLAAPAGLPPAIGERLNAEVATLLKRPEVMKALAAAGSATAYSTPEQMRTMIETDIARWSKVVEQRGLQIDG